MYYTVYLSTEFDLKGKVKKFIVKTYSEDVNTLWIKVNFTAKDNYYVHIKEGRKGWKQYGILTLEELLEEVEKFRFYNFVEKTVTKVETEECVIKLPKFVKIEDVWRKEFYLDGVERTFIKLCTTDKYFDIDTKYLFEEFNKIGIVLKHSCNPDIFYSLSDFSIERIACEGSCQYKCFKLTNKITTTTTEHVKEEI